MRGRATCACVMALAASGAAAAQTPVDSPQLAVCLVLSPKLSISVRAAALVLAESNAIWTPHRVGIRWAQPYDDSCDRRIAVKGTRKPCRRPETEPGSLTPSPREYDSPRKRPRSYSSRSYQSSCSDHSPHRRHEVHRH